MQEFEQKFGSGSKVFDIRGDARKVCSKHSQYNYEGV